MEDATPGVTDADKTPEQIERDMLETRESLTEKVSMLESQVLGDIRSVSTAVGSVKDAVTDTMQAVKDAVSGAPTAVSDTVKQTVAAVRESVVSFSLSDCIRNNPGAALGTSAVGGFLAGYFFGGGRRQVSYSAPPHAPERFTAAAGATQFGLHEPPVSGISGMFGGIIGGLVETATKELRAVAEEALSTGLASLKQTVRTQVPHLVDQAVAQVSERVAGVVHPEPNGTTRVGGPNYAAQPPTRR